MLPSEVLLLGITQLVSAHQPPLADLRQCPEPRYRVAQSHAVLCPILILNPCPTACHVSPQIHHSATGASPARKHQNQGQPYETQGSRRAHRECPPSYCGPSVPSLRVMSGF